MDVFEHILVLPNRRFGVERVATRIFFFPDNLTRRPFFPTLSDSRETSLPTYLFLERNLDEERLKMLGSAGASQLPEQKAVNLAERYSHWQLQLPRAQR
jgi:hypothetical protein